MIFTTEELFSHRTRGKWECYYRIPKLVTSRNGTIFAFAEERIGNVGDGAKQSVVVRRSLDGGASWRPIEVLLGHNSEWVSCGIQSGVADRETGRVIAFVSVRAVFPKDKGEAWQVEHQDEAREFEHKIAEEENVETGSFIMVTDDEGEHWSEPRAFSLDLENPVTEQLCRFHVGPGTGVQLESGGHSGRLVVPGRGWAKYGVFDLYAYSHNFVALSDDHGATWRPGGLAQTGTGEACVVECGDGSVYLNSRNESLRYRGYRAWDRSDDGGQTFASSGYDQALVEPHCHASLVRSRGPGSNGEILFCNPAVKSDTSGHFDADARRRLTVRISRDDGHTWRAFRVLTEGGAGYSDLDCLDDGTVLCLYESSALGASHSEGKLVFARFDSEWLCDK